MSPCLKLQVQHFGVDDEGVHGGVGGIRARHKRRRALAGAHTVDEGLAEVGEDPQLVAAAPRELAGLDVRHTLRVRIRVSPRVHIAGNTSHH